MRDLKKYDKLLYIEKRLDGSKVIKRKSPYNAQKEFEVIDIENEYPGSFKWIITKLTLMDTQRFDIVGKVTNNNLKMRNKDKDDRVTRDIAEFMHIGGESIVL